MNHQKYEGVVMKRSRSGLSEALSSGACRVERPCTAEADADTFSQHTMSAPTSPVSPKTPSPQPESQASSNSAASPSAHNPRCAQHPPIPTLFEPPTVPPPSYSASMSSLPNLGFPPGYFLIRSVANGRALDVAQNETKDGSKVVCWPEKEYSLVESVYEFL